MKKTDKISYSQKSAEELKKIMADLSKKYAESKAKHYTGNLKDTSTFKKMKYEISLISTLLSKTDNEKSN